MKEKREILYIIKIKMLILKLLVNSVLKKIELFSLVYFLERQFK